MFALTESYHPDSSPRSFVEDLTDKDLPTAIPDDAVSDIFSNIICDVNTDDDEEIPTITNHTIVQLNKKYNKETFAAALIATIGGILLAAMGSTPIGWALLIAAVTIFIIASIIYLVKHEDKQEAVRFALINTVGLLLAPIYIIVALASAYINNKRNEEPEKHLESVYTPINGRDPIEAESI